MSPIAENVIPNVCERSAQEVDLKTLNLLRSRFLASLRNDTKTNCDTVSKAEDTSCKERKEQILT